MDIITVLLQSKELALQRQELSQTKDTLQTQTTFLASQHDERLRVSNDQVIEQKLETLKKCLSRTDFEKIDAIDVNTNTLHRGHMTWMTNKSLSLDASPERLIASLNTFRKNAKLLQKKDKVLVRPDLKRWSQAKALCSEILKLSTDGTLGIQAVSYTHLTLPTKA